MAADFWGEGLGECGPRNGRERIRNSDGMIDRDKCDGSKGEEDE